MDPDTPSDVPTDRTPAESLAALLQSTDHRLTKAILRAFERVDWDDLERQTGDLRVGLARLAAAAAWTEQKRQALPTEEARRHREAQHRSSLSLVANHWDEWRELMRTHREQIDADRDAQADAEAVGEPTPPPPTTARG